MCDFVDVSLHLEGTGQGDVRYVESNYVGDLDKKRSLISHILLSLVAVHIRWKAALQSIMSTKAEYMRIIEACKEAIWLKILLSEISDDLKMVTVFFNSQCAIYLAKDHMFHERIKHIYVLNHFVRDIIAHDILLKARSPPITILLI